MTFIIKKIHELTHVFQVKKQNTLINAMYSIFVNTRLANPC